MKRELGIARCGLACCLCSENEHCNGCNSGDCPDKDWCENRKCSLEKSVAHCYECREDCRSQKLNRMALRCLQSATVKNRKPYMEYIDNNLVKKLQLEK